MKKKAVFILLMGLFFVHCKRIHPNETFISDQQKVALEQAEMVSRITKMPTSVMKDIPSASSLGNIKLQLSCPEYVAAALLDADKFRKLFSSVTAIDPGDKKVHFTPWYKGSFVSEGKVFEFDLGWNSLGVLKGPAGLPGWFEFNYDFLECDKFDKNRLSGCWETVTSWNTDSSRCYTHTLSFLDDGRVISRANFYKGQACSSEKEYDRNILRTMWTFKYVTQIALPDGKSGFNFQLFGDWGPGWDPKTLKPVWGHADAQGLFCYVDNRLCFSENISDPVSGLIIKKGVKNLSINYDNCLVHSNH